MMILTATIPISNISYFHPVVAQTVPISNVNDNSNVTSTNKKTPDLAIVPGKYIAKLKDTSELDSMGGLAASDPVSALTTDLESQGLTANVSSILTGTNTVFLEIEPSSDSQLAGLAPDADRQNITKAIEQILQDNPLVESAQADMAMTIPRPITNPNGSATSTGTIPFVVENTTSTQNIPSGVDRVDSEVPLTELDVVNADIAILDTGVNPHPDLNLFRQVSFIGTGPEDNCGHGTHVAGSAAAKNNDEGVVSAAPNARIWSVKVLESENLSDPEANCSTPTLEPILKGLNYVIDNADSIDVVNLSVTGYCPLWNPDCVNPVYEDTINDVIDNGIVVVIAAGNENMDTISFIPARFQNAITVSAISDSDGKCGAQGEPIWFGDKDDTFGSYSNYGTAIDIAAPGSDILSTWNNKDYNRITGTSMAAPHVTGVAALYKSLHPDASPSDVYNALLTAGTTSKDQCNGNGVGYFEADPDGITEPLLYGGNLSSFQQRN
jgi:subtilisin family serine protease